MHGERSACLAPESRHDVERTLGQADAGGELGHVQKRQAGVLGGLDHAGIPRRQRAADRAAEDLQRIIPRNDVARDAVRLAPRQHGEAGRIRNRFARELVGRSAVELEIAGTGGDVGARLAHRLAAVARLDQSQRIGMIENLAAQPREEAALLGRREATPRAVARHLRRAHRTVDVLGTAGCDGGERLAVRRIEHRQRRSGRRRDPAITDEMRRAREDRREGFGCVHDGGIRSARSVTSLRPGGISTRACSRRCAGYT